MKADADKLGKFAENSRSTVQRWNEEIRKLQRQQEIKGGVLSLEDALTMLLKHKELSEVPIKIASDISDDWRTRTDEFISPEAHTVLLRNLGALAPDGQLHDFDALSEDRTNPRGFKKDEERTFEFCVPTKVEGIKYSYHFQRKPFDKVYQGYGARSEIMIAPQQMLKALKTVPTAAGK